jgi:undecaprenyl-diphosphatase
MTTQLRDTERPAVRAMLTRRVHALIGGLVLLGIAALFLVALEMGPSKSWLQHVDDRWLSWMVASRTGWLTRLCKVLGTVGDTTVTLPVRLLVAAVLVLRRRWLQLSAFLGAVVTSELCIGPLKSFVDRPRPLGSLVDTSGASFPSGHAIAAAVTAFGLVLVLLPSSPRRLIAIAVAAAFSGLMALSRTYLAAHWLTDTLAGTAIGTGLALVWPASLELLRIRRTQRRGRLQSNAPPTEASDDGRAVGSQAGSQMTRGISRSVLRW